VKGLTLRWLGIATTAAIALPLLGLGASKAETIDGLAEPDEAAAAAESAPSETPETAPKKAEPLDHCMQRFLTPLAETAGMEPPTTAGAEWDEPLKAVLAQLGGGNECTTRFESVIATLADPIDSGFGYTFDTTLQALRLGVERDLGEQDGRFYRDRRWLPWDDREGSAEKAAESEECRHTMPGVVLFRGGDALRRRILVLMLVGETPTTGLHVTSMMKALAISERITDIGKGCLASQKQTDTRVVGPTFSGSAQSLRSSLERYAELSPAWSRKVEVTTGSASGSSLKRTLTQSVLNPGSKATPIEVEFASTTAAESTVQCAYLRFLHYTLGYGSKDQAALPGVALLHESGTEFGASVSAGAGDCPFKPSLDVAFPARISDLRDAYEDMDKKDVENAEQAAIARRTSLEVSLRERRRALTVESEASPKTTFAQDVALGNVLGAISRSSVRHVGVQATDVADAIFLSRRIRDIAPDVRLAFFASDVLLTHSAFRRDLNGSLVITPYPFLGSTDIAGYFDRGDPRQHQGFENGASLGIFNAMLAARGAKVDQLVEYTYTAEVPALPIWVTAVASGSLIPISLSPNQDKDDIVFPGKSRLRLDIGSLLPDEEEAAKRPAWKKMRDAQLKLDEAARVPRFWHFVYLMLALLFVIDRLVQRNGLARLSPVTIPGRLGRKEDRDADLAIIRTKWRLYAAMRTYVLAFGLGYMGLIYFLAFFTYWQHGSLSVIGTIVVGLVVTSAIVCAIQDARAFAVDYTALGRSVGSFSPTVWLSQKLLSIRSRRLKLTSSQNVPHSDEQSIDSAMEEDPVRMDRWDRISLPFGFARPEGRIPAARTSFAQVRLLANVALIVALLFTIGQFWVIFEEVQLRFSQSHPIPRTTLLALRSLPILNTVSPSAPTLWCVLAIYLWSVGRMARLRLASALSRISPEDGVADLVSTPIRVILYPAHGYGRKADESFTRVERRALNAVVRPVTGPNYFLALLAIVIVPVVLFTLKPPSTLERPLTTLLLVGGLALTVVLIGNTLIQLVQHWLALEMLLKRTFQHRIGRSFDRAATFVRDSFHHQVSRAPQDLLRLSGCAQLFDQLVRTGKALGSGAIASDERSELARRNASLQIAKSEALSASTLSDVHTASAFEAALGQAVLESARDAMRLLYGAWGGHLERQPPKEGEPADVPELGNIDPAERGEDALGAEAGRYTPAEFKWLRSVEAYVASVVALLIRRHVRQFQTFMYTLTCCGLLLLAAVSSYPFEPHRLLMTALWVIIGSIIVVGLFVYVELDRNALISRLSGTEAGHMTLDGALALRVFAWVVVPLLGVAAAQYPDLANTLFGAVEPFARALR
jgi:hypothetical protein